MEEKDEIKIPEKKLEELTEKEILIKIYKAIAGVGTLLLIMIIISLLKSCS